MTASPNPVALTQVFLIEDDEALGSALAEYLRLSGFAVHWVRSGIEFYAQVLQQSDFHVAIVDIGLPDQSGLVLAEYIRRNTHASVIVLTANDTPDRTAESYRLGVDLFMAKPVDSDVLVAAVASMALRYRQRAGLAVQESADAVPAAASVASPPPAGLSASASRWHLDRPRRNLLTPSGEVIELTRQELTFLLMLAEGLDQRAERSRVLEALYGRDDDSAQRALDTMVSRLRRKVSVVTQASAPILTDYGIGHSFSEPLALIGP